MKDKTAADFMTKTVVTVTEDILLIEAIQLLLRHRISCLPVVNAENTMLGIITEYDIMNFTMSGEADRAVVGEAMSRKVISFPPSADFAAIANCFVGQRIHRVPVVENDKVVGIVSRHDVLRVMMELYQK